VTQFREISTLSSRWHGVVDAAVAHMQGGTLLNSVSDPPWYFFLHFVCKQGFSPAFLPGHIWPWIPLSVSLTVASEKPVSLLNGRGCGAGASAGSSSIQISLTPRSTMTATMQTELIRPNQDTCTHAVEGEPCRQLRQGSSHCCSIVLHSTSCQMTLLIEIGPRVVPLLVQCIQQETL
jgi:hypothetical protein